MGKSNIEWTDMVWNPVTGCTKISEGCQNCYAERMAMRFTGHFNVTCHPDRLDQPLHWRKPRRIFVCSMSDLFHEDVPFEFIFEVFKRMWNCSRHQYLLLTKRPERIPEFDEWLTKTGRSHNRPTLPAGAEEFLDCYPTWSNHIWLGITAENQEQADKRIPILLQIPAAKRFVSIEPMLGPVKLRQSWQDYLEGWTTESAHDDYCDGSCKNCPVPVQEQTHKLDWVIVGAESGAGRRRCRIEWVRDIVGQCADAIKHKCPKCGSTELTRDSLYDEEAIDGFECDDCDYTAMDIEFETEIPLFIKQLHINGNLSKKMDEWPEDLRVREYPA